MANRRDKASGGFVSNAPIISHDFFSFFFFERYQRTLDIERREKKNKNKNEQPNNYFLKKVM